jgi:hypothetical protein
LRADLGSLGLGKTRAVYEALKTASGPLGETIGANFIFCDYRDVSTRLWDVANDLKSQTSASVLVVDECGFEDAIRLNALAANGASAMRVITLGNEGRHLGETCLMVTPRPADPATIHGILKNKLPHAGPDAIAYLAELCAGFPRIAVLASEAYDESRPVLRSVDDAAERILTATKLDGDGVRALEALSLFHQLSPDDEPEAFDRLSETLAHMKGGLMFEHLVIASNHHLVGRFGERMAAQPRPLADYLGLRRLSRLRASTVAKFLAEATLDQRQAMLARFRFLARSETLKQVVRRMLEVAHAQQTDLLADGGEIALDAFAHVDPDLLARYLTGAVWSRSLEDLKAAPITDALLDALRQLASRARTFGEAAKALVRIVAAHDAVEDNSAGEALSLLKQLFQLALAGSEAADRQKREVLAEMLDDLDLRVQRACVQALGAMLLTSWGRTGDFDDDGVRQDWTPATQEVVSRYITWALERLLALWEGEAELRADIEAVVVPQLRFLVGGDVFEAVARFARAVVKVHGHWFEAAQAIGDWLYFDRPVGETTHSRTVRALYDALLPTDLIDLALYYSRFWPADVRDPDARYRRDGDTSDLDFEYANRKAKALAPVIARDPEALARLIVILSTQEMNAPYALAAGLADALDEPVSTFQAAVRALDESNGREGVTFVRSFLGALDRRFAEISEVADALVAIANSSTVLSANRIEIYGALRLTDQRIAEVAQMVRAGEVAPRSVVPISYGRGLDGASTAILTILIDALLAAPEPDAWAALEILSMYSHDLSALSPELADLVKRALTAPSIMSEASGNFATRDYTFTRLVRLVHVSGQIDEAFARAYAHLIEKTCRIEAGVYRRPTESLRGALPTVMAAQATAVWAGLAGFYETASRAERDRLARTVGSGRAFAQDVDRAAAGTLFSAPESDLLNWVEGDSAERIGFLVSFYPLLATDEGKLTWHPAFLRLADRYGALPRFRNALQARILPSSWGGSLVTHLERFRAPLTEWAEIPLGPIGLKASWQRSILGSSQRASGRSSTGIARDKRRGNLAFSGAGSRQRVGVSVRRTGFASASVAARKRTFPISAMSHERPRPRREIIHRRILKRFATPHLPPASKDGGPRSATARLAPNATPRTPNAWGKWTLVSYLV